MVFRPKSINLQVGMQRTSLLPSSDESSSSGRFLISSIILGPDTTTSHWSRQDTLNAEP